MTQRKKSKASGGGEIGAALLGIGLALYNWITGHLEIVIIVVILVVVLIILLIIAKQNRIRKYWAWYFSRERGLQELGTQYLLQEETDDALNKQSRNIEGCKGSDYLELKNSCEKAYRADEIVWLEGDSVKFRGRSPFSAENLLASIDLHTDGTPAKIYCKTDEDGGYTFVLLPNAIYAFITGENSYSFVGAYDKSALKVQTDHMNFRKTYTNITDMSHQPRGYFLKYCDIHDSRAAAAGWQYETKDGYRDGRRQGNNYFIVEFNYARVVFVFGNMLSSGAFSLTDSGDRIKDCLVSYRKMVNKIPVLNNTKPELMDEDILATVIKDKPKNISAPSNNV